MAPCCWCLVYVRKGNKSQTPVRAKCRLSLHQLKFCAVTAGCITTTLMDVLFQVLSRYSCNFCFLSGSSTQWRMTAPHGWVFAMVQHCIYQSVRKSLPVVFLFLFLKSVSCGNDRCFWIFAFNFNPQSREIWHCRNITSRRLKLQGQYGANWLFVTSILLCQ